MATPRSARPDLGDATPSILLRTRRQAQGGADDYGFASELGLALCLPYVRARKVCRGPGRTGGTQTTGSLRHRTGRRDCHPTSEPRPAVPITHGLGKGSGLGAFPGRADVVAPDTLTHSLPVSDT